MSCVTVRGVTLGKGRPKIIVPIVEKDPRMAVKRAAEYTWSDPDLLEWRLDWLDELPDVEILAAMRRAAGRIPLLFTFRTRAEGGEKDLSMAEYRNLYAALCRSGCADLIDVELSHGAGIVQSILSDAHNNGVAVVLSSHDFKGTPSQSQLLAKLDLMRQLGADIAKIAVMPQTQADVLTLLGATWAMHTQYPELPLITMSMGALGQVSRVVAESFGCCATFGTAGKASAPGQVACEPLRKALDGLHEVYKED